MRESASASLATARPANQREFLLDLLSVIFLGLSLVKAPAFSILALLIPQYRQALVRALEQSATERRWWLALAVAAPLAGYLIGHPAPPDDLLRDMTVWRHHYDYRPMYWGSPGINAGDYYLGFDWAVGWIDRAFVHFGQMRWAWLGVTIPLCIATAAAFPAALLSRTRRRDPAAILLLAAVVFATWMVPDFGQRVKSGRPEAFATLWVLSAFLVSTRPRMVAWMAAGVALFSSYWFSWIYLPAFALLPRKVSWKSRAAMAACLSVYAVAFWLIASHGHFLGWYFNLAHALHNRVAPVMENVGLLAESFLPAATVFTALALVALWLGRFEEDASREGASPYGIALVAAWFLLPNMVRYVEMVYTLMAMLIYERALALVPRAPSPRALAAAAGTVFILCMVSGAGMFSGQGAISRGYVLASAKPGDKVLTWFGPDTYDALFVNPEVRLAPAFEVGMSTPAVQRASLALGKGQVSCETLHAMHVRWVIAPPQAPVERLAQSPCLHLAGSSHHSSVWSVGSEIPGKAGSTSAHASHGALQRITP